MRVATLALSLLLASVGLAAGRAVEAEADFTAPTLLSGTSQLQFDEADSPAFSSDGKYVVFRGSLAGEPGIYRRDLQSGEVVPVIAEDSSAQAIAAPDASAPSISADGRYVAFTSAADLDPAQEPTVDEGCPEVYVRDMSLSWTEAEAHPEWAFTLASAVNGTDEGITFAPRCPARSATQLALAGAQAAPAVALSADGRKVAFTVLSFSNLAGSCVTAPEIECSTEPSQVAVRDLDTKATTLVSATPEGWPTPGGGAFPSVASAQRLGLNGNAIGSLEPTASSAAISADGTTIAWQGTNVPNQVRAATDVTSGMDRFGGAGLEVEPLWRRIADGPGAVTKRLMGQAGLNFYFEASHENLEVIEGGATAPAKQVFAPPALSADGTTVATVANAPTSINEGSYAFLKFTAPPPTELYAVHVEDGSPVPRVLPLTATPDFAAQNAIFDGVNDVAVSADGTRVVFNTQRVSFSLPSPILVSPPVPELTHGYTYEVDLPLGTLQRVTHTYEGSPPNGDPGLLSLSGDGRSLAFASDASNLFYGDATTDSSQVYLTSETEPVGQLVTQSVGVTPLVPLPKSSWTLSATAVAQKDGSVLVYAFVPGAGKLAISATAQLPASSPRSPKLGRSHRPVAGAPPRLLTRTIARAAAIVERSSQLRLSIRETRPYRTFIASKKGLYTVLRLTFTAAGHVQLVREIPVELRRETAARVRKPSSRRKSQGKRKPESRR